MLCRKEVLSKGESNLPVTGAMIRFTFLCNMTGHPAASVPIGLAEPTGGGPCACQHQQAARLCRRYDLLPDALLLFGPLAPAQPLRRAVAV